MRTGSLREIQTQQVRSRRALECGFPTRGRLQFLGCREIMHISDRTLLPPLITNPSPISQPITIPFLASVLLFYVRAGDNKLCAAACVDLCAQVAAMPIGVAKICLEGVKAVAPS